MIHLKHPLLHILKKSLIIIIVVKFKSFRKGLCCRAQHNYYGTWMKKDK